MFKKLSEYTLDERSVLAQQLIQEQIVDQRGRLHEWTALTKQPAQIDTGYIGQHLVSLVSGVEGGGFRGKGDDLCDGSEVKSANFLDSLDARGAVAPRWNFTCNDEAQMKAFLNYPRIYLVSVDLNVTGNTRVRVWEVVPKEHKELLGRYLEWMRVLGLPKLNDPRRPGVNFQLFPPKSGTDETFARHGNGLANGFPRLCIELDNHEGTHKVFHAEEESGKVRIISSEVIF